MYESTPTASPAPARVRHGQAAWLSPRAARLLTRLGVSFDPRDPRIERLERATHEADPLGDALTEAIFAPGGQALRPDFERALAQGTSAGTAEPVRALLSAMEAEPAWLDRERVALGARCLRRHGRDGLISLAGAALMSGYLSAPIAKPLIWTGALRNATPRRLATTSQLTHDVALSDLTRFSSGFRTAARVRLMHAFVRRRLSNDPGWREDLWGVPINQRDMLATQLQFSTTYMAGVLALGRIDTPREWQAVSHLWRYVSWLIGADDSLSPRHVWDALELAQLLNATEPGPDDDGRALAHSLMEAFSSRAGGVTGAAGRWLLGRFSLGYARNLMGDEAAERLALPDTAWKHLPPLIAASRLPFEVARLVSPAARARDTKRGAEILRLQLEVALAGEPPPFWPTAHTTARAVATAA